MPCELQGSSFQDYSLWSYPWVAPPHSGADQYSPEDFRGPCAGLWGSVPGPCSPPCDAAWDLHARASPDTQAPRWLPFSKVPPGNSPGRKLRQSQRSSHLSPPLSGIIVLCCLVCSVWKHLFSAFFLLLKLFQMEEGKASHCHSILARSRSPVESFGTICSF